MASPRFRDWIQDRLVRVFNIDAVPYVDYLISYVESEEDPEGLDQLLNSLSPDDPTLKEEWEMFKVELPEYFREPNKIPTQPQPSSTISKSSSANALLLSPGGLTLNDHFSASSPSQGGWIGSGSAQEAEDEEDLEACGAGLEGLCLEVVAALYDDDKEERGDNHAGGRVLADDGLAGFKGAFLGGAAEEEGEDDGYCWGEGEEEEEGQIREIQLAVLLETFPQCSPDSLMVVIVRCGLDLDLAVSTIESALNPPQQPCRYFMSGFCARSDCTFSHDLETMPCTYWLVGACRNEGGGCPFLHDVVVVPSSAVVSGSGRSHPHRPDSPTLQPEQFPALSSASSSSVTTTTTTTTTNPSLNRSGPTFLEVLRKNGGHQSNHRQEATTSLPPSHRTGPPGRQASAVGKRLLEGMWAMGGTQLKTTYMAAREAAATAARARNAFFIRGTEAFQRGDKAAASVLSAKGREMNALMRQKHREAALHIFASRNPSPPRIYKEGILDLHGLHVAEAVELLDSMLPALIGAKVKEACILTGSGHHSGAIQRGQARLFPAVQQYVMELGTQYGEIVDRNGIKGGFNVTLTPDLLAWWPDAEEKT